MVRQKVVVVEVSVVKVYVVVVPVPRVVVQDTTDVPVAKVVLETQVLLVIGV